MTDRSSLGGTPTSRTRLDAIIEKEHNLDLRGLCHGDQVAVSIGALRDSHERAYRLGGTDIALLANKHFHAFLQEKVQPAPAGEKGDPVCHCGCGGSVRAHVQLDRRKGVERRKGLEGRSVLDDGDFGRQQIYRLKDGTYKYDRRSGKERRK